MRSCLWIVFLCALLAFAASAPAASWVEDLRLKAEQGDPFAQTTLGVCYELGEGVKQNLKSAIHWYELAAKKDWPGALLRLGRCYARGIGLKADAFKAVELWQKALALPARPGSVEETSIQEARAALARAARLGLGMDKDIQKAIAWAAPAAQWGLPDGEYELGMALLAQDRKKNLPEASRLLRQAMNSGSEEAKQAVEALDKNN